MGTRKLEVGLHTSREANPWGGNMGEARVCVRVAEILLKQLEKNYCF